MSSTGDALKSEPIHLTTNPKSIFSWNAAFNISVWAAAGGFLGSKLSIPTPEGIYSLTGPGALAGAGSYAILVLEQQGFEKWFQDWIDFITAEGSHTEPVDPKKSAAFEERYGVSFAKAGLLYAQLHPGKPVPDYNTFMSWVDQYYLKENPNQVFTYWGLNIEAKVWLDTKTQAYFERKFGLSINQAMDDYFQYGQLDNNTKQHFLKLFNIPGTGVTPYVDGQDWKQFLLWLYHSPFVLHTQGGEEWDTTGSEPAKKGGGPRKKVSQTMLI